MSKEKPTEGVEEKLFEGFNFLDAPVPKETVKAAKEKALKEPLTQDDDLSDEDIAAVEATVKATKKVADTKAKKAVKEEDSIEDVIEEEEEVKEPEESVFAILAKDLSSKGIVDLDEADKVETEDDLYKVVGKTVNNGISSYKQSLPEDGQKFLEFVENGGNPAEFHKLYYGDGSFEDFTIEDEDSQKHVIKEALKLEDFSDEEIEEELNDIIDMGKLEKKASTYLNKLKKVEKEQKALLLEAQKTYAKQQEAARAQEWETFKKGLFDKETIGGFKITPKLKEDLWDYMTKPVNKKTGETAYQRDSKENEDARYMFAYLLKNKWDIKALERQVESKQVSKLKDKLSSYSDTSKKLKSAKTNVESENNENPFAAFKKVLN